MKHGKIILGAIAMVVAAGSTLAFKVAKHGRGGQVLYATRSGSACLQSSNCFTTTGSNVGTCKTHAGNNNATHVFTTAACSSGHTWTGNHTTTAQ